MATLLLSLTFQLSYGEETIKKPLCKDGAVVLSKLEIPCKLDLRGQLDFDIPELNLNLDSLDLIFKNNRDSLLGSESSGGREVGPLNRPIPTATGRRSARPFSYQCKASLISDGGKTISYFSQTLFSLDQNQMKKQLKGWKHFLFQGNEFPPEKLYPVGKAPSIGIPKYSLEVHTIARGEKYKFELCLNEDSQYCTEKTYLDFNSRIVELKFKKSQIVNDVKIQQKLKLQCFKHY